MIFRFLARYFTQNEQLVNKLAESYPIRRAAQWVIYFFTKSKAVTDETLSKQKLSGDDIEKTLKKIRDRLQDQLQK